MAGNALIIDGGAPTAVINASLYGAIMEAESRKEIGKFYAAIGGAGGLLGEKLLDLGQVSKKQVALLPYSPASAIGTSRDALQQEDYEEIAQVLKKHDIKYVFFNGGNGSMDACGKVYQACKDAGYEVCVVGIPKTIDNDLAVTDHAPGYGSAARYLAGTVSEISRDIRALPIHVCIVEAMGRNAGWITAASALARKEKDDGPDLIYLPECPFNETTFLDNISRLHRDKGGVLVVASEGLRTAAGAPIVPPVFQVGRATYYGDVSAHLANLVIKNLGIKARSEKPGICGRASIAFQSTVDREEAILAGREAVRAAVAGKSGIMIGFERLSTHPYRMRVVHIPISQVMLRERILPDTFISPGGNGVTEAFIRWCEPLLGGELPQFADFSGSIEKMNMR